MKKIALLLLLTTFMNLTAQNMNPSLQKLGIAANIINSLYVDKVDEEKLTEDAIRGMLDKLDPHSNYLTPDEVKEMNEPLQGNFDGVGIQFNMLTDTLYVVQTIAGGPSEKVGILAGDRILTVNDSLIAGVKMKTTDIMKRLRGKKGTEVRVTVLRNKEKQPIEFKIIRDKIPIYSLDAAYMVDHKTGYIALNRFAATSHEEFAEALKKLKKEKMENLILDLQGNGGGYMNTAIEIADEFLAQGKQIVYTQGRNRDAKDEALATLQGNFEKGKLIVLVDEYSASASEIVAGAIQDNDRGVIVGRRTFGKGLVQRPIPLFDGSMIRLTIARYYTPAGRSIQKPYTKGELETYTNDLISRYNNGELQHADSIHFPDSLRFTTVQNKRIVYGGGGIMPDNFVPLDTLRFTPYHRQLVASGSLNKYVMQYIEEQRTILKKKYPTADNFIAHFTVTPDMITNLVAVGEKEKVTLNEKELTRSNDLISLQVKALVGRDIFENAVYTRIMNVENPTFLQAMKILQSDKLYHELLGTKK